MSRGAPSSEVLGNARRLVEAGELKPGLKALDEARRGALAEGDINGLEQVVTLAALAYARAEGRDRQRCGEIDYAARQNIRFLSRRQAFAEGKPWIDPAGPIHPQSDDFATAGGAGPGAMSDAIDEAVRLYESGWLEDAARLVGRVRRQALRENDVERLAELESVVMQMQSHLSGEDRVSFDDVLAADRMGFGERLDGISGGLRYLLLAAGCLVATWLPLAIGAAFGIYPLGYWGVLSAYIGLSWLLPGVFIGLAVADWAKDHDRGHPRAVGAAAGVVAGAAAIVGISVFIAALGGGKRDEDTAWKPAVKPAVSDRYGRAAVVAAAAGRTKYAPVDVVMCEAGDDSMCVVT